MAPVLTPLSFLISRVFGRSRAGNPQDSYPVSPATILPQVTSPTRDQIRTDSAPRPYVDALDLDNYGAETDEIRRQYLRYHRTEPALRAALTGLVNSVADMDVMVLPDDEDDPRDQEAAKFLEWTIDRSQHGWDGLIRHTLEPALMMGYSIGELVLKATEDHRRYTGLWGLHQVASKDTTHLRLRVDVYRNVIGVVNTVRGLATYSPDKIVLFTHADLFSNPHGVSEVRAAYRACVLIENTYKLWDFALNVNSGPFLSAKTSSKDRRQQLAQALAAARAGGYIVYDSSDEVEILNLASATSFDAFEKKIDKLREEVFLTIRGAYLPFIESGGGGGDVRGDAGTTKTSGSDPKERLIAKSIGRCLTHQIAAPITRVNYGNKVGIPKIVLGGVDWGETSQQLDVAKRLTSDFGLPVSKKWLYKISQTQPPQDDQDEARAPTPPGMPGMPALGMGGFSPSTSELQNRQQFSASLAEYFFDESAHPRDDHGRFVSGSDLEQAKTDPAKAQELRQRVTNPEQRAKLDKAIGSDSGHTSTQEAPFNEEEARSKIASMPGLSDSDRTGLLGAVKGIYAAGSHVVKLARAVASAVHDEAKLWSTKLALHGITYAEALPDTQESTNPLTGSTAATGGEDWAAKVTGIPGAQYLALKVVPQIATYAVFKTKSLLSGKKVTHADLLSDDSEREKVIQDFRAAINKAIAKALGLSGDKGGSGPAPETFRR